MTFHNIRFPTDISLGATGGPERRTDIVLLGSGHEERNSRWKNSRRRYNAGYGVKSVDQLYQVIHFFEERRGRLYGFRWKDFTDYKSAAPRQSTSALDQELGVGDGVRDGFQLIKTYGQGFSPWTRKITKPVPGSVAVAVSDEIQTEGEHYVVDSLSGIISFLPDHVPEDGALIQAGFEFDIAVRFDTDFLEINLSNFHAGNIPSVPVIEVRQ